ncbi:hypothetical protein BDN70DRAFT_997309 [Pholiota conissans]|uniref:Uncharacterized protein n=1 Tax=Pholiota conissans TaxID=109636 RepID=A0A9P5YRB2_9AGAR|nr:hypothetical protein BDN70DRAFT_997309 [Pholiota conissans]
MSALPYKNPHFSFLAHPPPPKKRSAAVAPDAALPPTPPQKFTAILSWAATVQPGSPAPPTPDSQPISRRSSRSRASFSSSTASPRRSRRPSVASLLGGARSPSVADKFDLTALGYTSVFVHLPKTPTTPSPVLREYDLKHHRNPAPAPAPILEPSSPSPAPAPKRRSTMRRFRSLSILRPRGKQPQQQSKADSNAPLSPTSPKPSKAPKPSENAIASPTTATTPGSASKAEICAATIAKRKRAKYAYVRPPPSLAQELAVMQFADGGKLETHIQRVMEEQARLAAGSRAGGAGGIGGIADVYRDDKGGVWWDADEEMEYAHLLGGEVAQDAALRAAGNDTGDVEMGWEWEAFNDAGAGEPLAPFLALRTAPLPTTQQQHSNDIMNLNDDRRSSISSLDSDLDPQYLLPLPENEDPRAAPVDDRVLASSRIGGKGMSVLSLPSRPRRAALHLAKPSRFLVGEAFKAPASPPLAHGSEKENAHPMMTSATKPRGKARRRPAPLKLASSAHTVTAAAGSTPAPRRRHHHHHHHHHHRAQAHGAPPATPPSGALPPIPDLEGSRKAFIADSFAPAVPVLSVPQKLNLAQEVISAPPPMTPSRMAFKGVKGLFALGRKLSVAVAN